MGYVRDLVQRRIPGIYVLSLRIGSSLVQVLTVGPSPARLFPGR